MPSFSADLEGSSSSSGSSSPQNQPSIDSLLSCDRAQLWEEFLWWYFSGIEEAPANPFARLEQEPIESRAEIDKITHEAEDIWLCARDFAVQWMVDGDEDSTIRHMESIKKVLCEWISLQATAEVYSREARSGQVTDSMDTVELHRRFAQAHSKVQQIRIGIIPGCMIDDPYLSHAVTRERISHSVQYGGVIFRPLEPLVLTNNLVEPGETSLAYRFHICLSAQLRQDIFRENLSAPNPADSWSSYPVELAITRRIAQAAVSYCAEFNPIGNWAIGYREHDSIVITKNEVDLQALIKYSVGKCSIFLLEACGFNIFHYEQAFRKQVEDLPRTDRDAAWDHEISHQRICHPRGGRPHPTVVDQRSQGYPFGPRSDLYVPDDAIVYFPNVPGAESLPGPVPLGTFTPTSFAQFTMAQEDDGFPGSMGYSDISPTGGNLASPVMPLPPPPSRDGTADPGFPVVDGPDPNDPRWLNR